MIKKVFLYTLIIGISIGILTYLGLLISSARGNLGAAIKPSSNEELQTANQTKSDLELLIENEVNKLRNGRILYNIPEYMKVGQTEIIEVRIEKSTTDVFVKNLQGSGNYEIGDIKTAPLMKVKLICEGNKLQVVEVSDAEQIVIDNHYTQWVWDITPLKSGQAFISLIVSFKLSIPNQVDKYQDYVLFNKQINVKINPLFSLSSFIAKYWQWLFVTILMPVATFVYKKLSKPAKINKNGSKKQEEN